MKRKKFRLLDRPPASAAENMALDEVMLEAKNRGMSPDTLRFMQFTPAAVLVGFHQSVEEEVRTDWCAARGIEVNRRITGGGAIYLDPSQLGWELCCDKRFLGDFLPSPALFRRLSEPVVAALRSLGVRASFRPRNDIEVDGRKISGMGGTDAEKAFLFHGSLLVDFDGDTMVRALKTPVEKLEAKEIESIGRRVTSLKEQLGRVPPMEELKAVLRSSFEEHLGIELEPADLTNLEKELFGQALGWFRSKAWIDPPRPSSGRLEVLQGSRRADGGLVKFTLLVNRSQGCVRQAWVTGDFLAFPSRGLYDLEARLRGAPLDQERLSGIVRSFFEEGRIQIPGMGCEDFLAPLEMALRGMSWSLRP